MIEPEAAWFEYEDNLQLQEQFVSYIVKIGHPGTE